MANVIESDNRHWIVDGMKVEWIAMDGVEMDPSEERDDHAVQVAHYAGRSHGELEIGPAIDKE